MISPVKTDTLIFTILIVITITLIIITVIIITTLLSITILLLLILPLIIIIIIIRITIIIIRFTGLRLFQHKGKIVDSVLIRKIRVRENLNFLNCYDYYYHNVFIYSR